jgi:hypothetical protein
VLVLIALYIDRIVVLGTVGRKSILDVSEAVKVIERFHGPDVRGVAKATQLKLYGFGAGVVTVMAFLLHRGASQCV